jgi:hypothetical protein
MPGTPKIQADKYFPIFILLLLISFSDKYQTSSFLTISGRLQLNISEARNTL